MGARMVNPRILMKTCSVNIVFLKGIKRLDKALTPSRAKPILTQVEKRK